MQQEASAAEEAFPTTTSAEPMNEDTMTLQEEIAPSNTRELIEEEEQQIQNATTSISALEISPGASPEERTLRKTESMDNLGSIPSHPDQFFQQQQSPTTVSKNVLNASSSASSLENNLLYSPSTELSTTTTTTAAAADLIPTQTLSQALQHQATTETTSLESPSTQKIQADPNSLLYAEDTLLSSKSEEGDPNATTTASGAAATSSSLLRTASFASSSSTSSFVDKKQTARVFYIRTRTKPNTTITTTNSAATTTMTTVINKNQQQQQQQENNNKATTPPPPSNSAPTAQEEDDDEEDDDDDEDDNEDEDEEEEETKGRKKGKKRVSNVPEGNQLREDQNYIYLQENKGTLMLHRYIIGSRAQQWQITFKVELEGMSEVTIRNRTAESFLIKNVDTGRVLCVQRQEDDEKLPAEAQKAKYKLVLCEIAETTEEDCIWWCYDGNNLISKLQWSNNVAISNSMSSVILDVQFNHAGTMELALFPMVKYSEGKIAEWEIVKQGSIINDVVIVDNYFEKKRAPASSTSSSSSSASSSSASTERLYEGSLQIKVDTLFATTWKKRYFVLFKDGNLSYFEKSTDTKPLGSVHLKKNGVQFHEQNSKGKPLCLALMAYVAANKKPQTIVVCAYSFAEYKEWKSALQTGGAIEVVQAPKKGFLDAFTSTLLMNKTSTRAMSRVETMDVEEWTISDVQEWLSYIHTPDGNMATRFGEAFIRNDVDGRLLIRATDQQLREIGVNSLGIRKKLLKEIEKLKRNRKYDLNEHLVFSKVKNMDPKYLKSIPDMEDMVKSLCDVKEIRQTYLNTERLSSEQLKKWIEISSMGTKSSKPSQQDDEFDLVQEKELRQYEELKIRVKLVITEIVHTDREKQLRKVLSPVIARIPTLNSEFGLFHSAVVVGPWYLEWTDSSLCIPKKICSSMALLSADVDNIIVQKDRLPEIADKIAECVVDWNVNNVYVNMKASGKKPNEGNCQDFVDSILDKLGVKPVFSGALGTFLEEMRIKGTCNLEFRPDKAFRQTFQLTQPSYTFETHAELDTFVMQLKQKCNTFKLDYPSEWGLLKSFDRAFWLRHFKQPKNAKYVPLMAANSSRSNTSTPAISETRCAFGNPMQTFSYV